MKKICSVLLLLTMAWVGIYADDQALTKERSGMYVVNTTSLVADIDGYMAPTPLKIYIKGDKIDHIEALPNQETPKYFIRVKKEMLTKWDGKKVKTVLGELNPAVDVVTGATYSSNAVIENVKRGLQYYQKQKKNIK